MMAGQQRLCSLACHSVGEKGRVSQTSQFKWGSYKIRTRLFMKVCKQLENCSPYSVHRCVRQWYGDSCHF